MNADVEKAAQRFDSHFAERASSLSITAAITLHSWQTIRQALRDQEAEIARLRQAFGISAVEKRRVDARLEATEALLRDTRRFAAWAGERMPEALPIYDRITAHLGAEQ
jgi:hypothetical protein